MKTVSRILSLVLSVLLLCGMFGTVASAEAINVTIPHYKTGENVGAKFFLPQVERFNELYADKYHITVEELTQDMYADKMKQLGQQGKLPALVEGGETEWIKNVIIANGLFTDLSAFVEEHPELKALLLPNSVAYNTTEDGKMFSVQLPVTRPIGLYYNGEMLDLGEKSCATMNWDEFAAALGENKIAFGTGENAWTIGLVYSSLIAAEEGGAELLLNSTIDKIYDYTQAPIVNATAKLQALLQNYGMKNQAGAVYADCANSFMSKNSAVIANGSWMVADFTGEDASTKWSNSFDGKTVRGDVLPGNIALDKDFGFGWWVPSTVSDAEKEVALAFIAFMNTPAELESYMLAEGGVSPSLSLSEAYTAAAKESPLMYEYVNAVNADTKIVPNVLDCMPSSIANTEFGNLLPSLISGDMTPEQFCSQLSVLAEETKLD